MKWSRVSVRSRPRFLAITVAIACVALSLDVPSACSQTVQLPSVRQFSYRGGVLVPDGGSTFLGGNRSSAMSSASRGLPGLPNVPGSNLSSRGSAGSVSASVTIIDLDEMDRQILGYDPHDKKQRRRVDGVPVAGSVERTVADEIAEAKSLVRNARRALSEGHPSTARHAYQLAIEKLSRVSTQTRRSPGSTGSPNESRSSGNFVSVNHQPDYLLAYARAEYAKAFPPTNNPPQKVSP